MLCYKDTTFCINKACQNKCRKYLTKEIEQAAKHFGLSVVVAEFICLDKGEDGIYECETEESEC